MALEEIRNSGGEEPEDDRATSTLQTLAEIRTTKLTNEEEAVLDEFESFRREHPFSLVSLNED